MILRGMIGGWKGANMRTQLCAFKRLAALGPIKHCVTAPDDPPSQLGGVTQ
ncbi:hypothetical protein GCM10016234_19560 [Tianweitania populi]|uniref:Uncharacterized protein n=1 Tax=Tianweitania populi TaxID=1607949 RepID=A0A8J3DVE1_9HYPH|nr:hypothetical protein GCM10016234_19560 [Tianweitania populi]